MKNSSKGYSPSEWEKFLKSDGYGELADIEEGTAMPCPYNGIGLALRASPPQRDTGDAG
jgi:hypothetical protein